MKPHCWDLLLEQKSSELYNNCRERRIRETFATALARLVSAQYLVTNRFSYDRVEVPSFHNINSMRASRRNIPSPYTYPADGVCCAIHSR